MPRVFERYLRHPDGSRAAREFIQDPATTIRVLREQLAEARRERDEARASRPLVAIGTTSGAPTWTEEQLAEWLTNSGAHRRDVAAEVAKRIFNPQPTMVVRIESKEPA